ncbi:MAG: M48 family metalloprotease [Myxococcales bacterium]|nr:M48 family metalloprotease [Myxococcales bacterium]
MVRSVAARLQLFTSPPFDGRLPTATGPGGASLTDIDAETHRRLLSALAAEPAPAPRRGWRGSLALLLCVLAIAWTLALAMAGGWLLLQGSVGSVVVGVLLLAFAFVLRPRVGAPPSAILARAEHPTLYGLVDAAAVAIGAPRVAGVVVDGAFSASVGTAGWRQRTYLRLGLPLIAALTPRELAALLGHELGHQVNGDPLRGHVAGVTDATLATWTALLEPDHPWDVAGSGFARLAELATNALLVALSLLPRAARAGLHRLVAPERQRAEYLADLMGARLGGTDAAVGMLRKLALAPLAEWATQQAGLHGDDPVVLFERALLDLDDAQRARLQAAHEVEHLPMLASHPPAALRIELLCARPREDGLLAWGTADLAALRAELAARQAAIAREVRTAYRASLYA